MTATQPLEHALRLALQHAYAKGKGAGRGSPAAKRAADEVLADLMPKVDSWATALITLVTADPPPCRHVLMCGEHMEPIPCRPCEARAVCGDHDRPMPCLECK